MFEKLKNRNVLITGGAGFLGSHLAEALLARGANVICLDNLITGRKENVKHLAGSQRFRLMHGDANDYGSIASVFSSFDIGYVFHYAATVGVLKTVESPGNVVKDLDGIKNILDLSREHGVKKVIFASSSEVYGEPTMLPEKESGELNATMPYALVKVAGENYLRLYWKAFGLPTCSLRFFNVYGPRQNATPYGFVVGIFIRQALNGELLTVFGDGSQTRDFVFVEDNVEAAIKALLSAETNGQSINIGAGRPVTVLELAKKVIAVSGNLKLGIRFLPLRKSGEIKHRCPDVTLMDKFLGYYPKYTLEDGLRKTLDWYRMSPEIKNRGGH